MESLVHEKSGIDGLKGRCVVHQKVLVDIIRVENMLVKKNDRFAERKCLKNTGGKRY